jgi:hypothetical protein
MSQNQIRVTYLRGGREFSRRVFTPEEARRTTFGQAHRQEQLTIGMGNQFDLWVEGDREIAAHGREDDSLDSVLRAASEDGEISGKTFVIDCTVEHKGAQTPEYGRKETSP